MNAVQITALSIAFMVVSCVLVFALPVVLYIVLHKNLKARFIPVLKGAATFIVAALPFGVGYGGML